MQEKNWRVELSKSALKSLKKLEEKTAKRVLDIRPLTGKIRGCYRLMVGDFRIIFELDRRNKRIGVHIIVFRGSAY